MRTFLIGIAFVLLCLFPSVASPEIPVQPEYSIISELQSDLKRIGGESIFFALPEKFPGTELVLFMASPWEQSFKKNRLCRRAN